LPNVCGLLLETTSPGGTSKEHRIFPTTKTTYQKGERVAWEWNLGKKYGQAWYKDPDTGEIKSAWRGSAEFVGRNFDKI